MTRTTRTAPPPPGAQKTAGAGAIGGRHTTQILAPPLERAKKGAHKHQVGGASW